MRAGPETASPFLFNQHQIIMSRTDKQIAEFLQSEDGKRNVERFIKALKEQRIVVSIPHVSSSGMSRIIRFREIGKYKSSGKYHYIIYQFDWFFEHLGYCYDKNWDGIKVGGCGMDMVFHTLYSVCGTLKHYGFKVPANYTSLADDYLKV